MYNQLYQYFIQHKELSVPGIGTFLLERNPATVDFPNKMILPPTYSINLKFPSGAPSTTFFSWMANALQISDREVVVRFNDFAYDMKQQILSGTKINWSGMGSLYKGLAGEVKFNAALKEVAFEKPLGAEKVIREMSDHVVRVGEEERTSAQMSEILNKEKEKKSAWWAWALVAGLLAVIFLGWYFSENGISVFSTANTIKNVPAETSSTYQLIPQR